MQFCKVYTGYLNSEMKSITETSVRRNDLQLMSLLKKKNVNRLENCKLGGAGTAALFEPPVKPVNVTESH